MLKNMEKKLIVEFKAGNKVEINAEELVDKIAERIDNDSHSDTVAELLKNELKLFAAVWALPWVEITPHIDCKDQPRPVCLCSEWKKGNAKISINW
jgi:hypothetical protein